MLEDNITQYGEEHAKEVFYFSDGKKRDHRFFIDYLLLSKSETLPAEWCDISSQIRHRAEKLEIAVCNEDTDLAILKKIDSAIGNTDSKKYDVLKRKGELMARWEAMSPAERNAEIEAKRIARDREILAARRELSAISAATQNVLQHGRRKESGISTKPREHRAMGNNTDSGGQFRR